jgi:F0F1-type ATP synthase epsilon subunit
MPETFELSVLNPAETLLEVSEARWVHLRLADGTGITIYPGHALLLAETITAPLRYADETGEHVFSAEAGILQVEDERVMILTSGRCKAETTPRTSTVPEERRFERLARELQVRLETEMDGTLRGALTADHE